MPRSRTRLRQALLSATLIGWLAACSPAPAAPKVTPSSAPVDAQPPSATAAPIAAPTVTATPHPVTVTPAITPSPAPIGIGDLGTISQLYVQVTDLQDPAEAPLGLSLPGDRRLVSLTFVVGHRSEYEHYGVPNNNALFDADGHEYRPEWGQEYVPLITPYSVDLLFPKERTQFTSVYNVHADARLDHVSVGWGDDVACVDLSRPPAQVRIDLPPYELPSVPPLGRTLETAGYTLVAHQVLESPATKNHFVVPNGYRLVAVEITAGVTTGAAIDPSLGSVYLITQDGFAYRSSVAYRLQDAFDFYTPLQPGEERTGTIGFVIPETAVPALYRFWAGQGTTGEGVYLAVGLQP